MKARLTGMMIVLVLGCIAPSLAAADDLTENYARYAGFQVTGLLESFDDFGGLLDYENSFGLGARLGLRIDGNSESMDYAFELNINWYSSIDVDDAATGLKVAELDAFSVMLRPKVYATNLGSDVFEPYAFIGIGFMNGELTIPSLSISADATELAFEIGVGSEWNVTDSMSLFAEVGYFQPTGDLDDFPFVTIAGGLNYKF